VIWGGEFGRTSDSQGSPSDAITTRKVSPSGWLAAASKPASTHGATDEFGYKAVEENRVHVNDLHATMLHLLGIDHEKLTYRHSGRDYRLTDVGGHVIRDILT
jgi:hypothetical protein